MCRWDRNQSSTSGQPRRERERRPC
uniref:Uncharacterized protein n=1 Tax=Anguilla anguilla TaxID=7936 RepID=A0A0E9SIT6_ANGAN